MAKTPDTTAPILDARTQAQASYAPALTPELERVRQRLMGLDEAPQVLLFEGGTEPQRQALALWWAALEHCEHAADAGVRQAPCLDCPSCIQIGAGLYRDVLMYDGRISNKDDEENPGAVRAFNMDNSRELKSRIADATRSGRKRVVILSGIDISREAASNALLKTLEEPSTTTVFVLLTPQREQLLPTLVSRSWVITLPWQGAAYVDASLLPWEAALTEFLRTGRDWWGMTGAKGSVDQSTAQRVILQWQKALVRSHTPSTNPSPLEGVLAQLPSEKRLMVQQRAAALLDEAQEALLYAVSAPRVLDSTATRLFLLVRKPS